MLFQVLSQHHHDATGATNIGELVKVFVLRNASQREATMAFRDLKSCVDVIDR